MEDVKQILEPFIDWLPPPARDYWWAILGAAALAVVLVLLAAVRRLFRALFGRRRPARSLDLGPVENLDEYPLPLGPAGQRRLTVEGLPVRLRLVVVAPLGKQGQIREADLPELLDQVLWGLGTLYREDSPGVRLWPPQLSSQGFAAAFHRRLRKREPEGQPSRWVLVAGPTPPRPRPVLLGLALWADAVNRIGRLTLEPGQWSSVLRIQSQEG
jgi:hypothetical protein